MSERDIDAVDAGLDTSILRTAGKADTGEQDGLFMNVGEEFITGFRTHVEQIKLPMLANGTMTLLIELISQRAHHRIKSVVRSRIAKGAQREHEAKVNAV